MYTHACIHTFGDSLCGWPNSFLLSEVFPQSLTLRSSSLWYTQSGPSIASRSQFSGIVTDVWQLATEKHTAHISLTVLKQFVIPSTILPLQDSFKLSSLISEHMTTSQYYSIITMLLTSSVWRVGWERNMLCRYFILGPRWRYYHLLWEKLKISINNHYQWLDVRTYTPNCIQY